MKKVKQKWVDKEFEKNVKRLYPESSFSKATRNLNKVLEELLYGTKD